ncbi:MAG: hypothetical protein GEU80_07025 [Dehalococcoidia bacterium]|nr:hypothetical protein [Dehalococcoidia bacterium]
MNIGGRLRDAGIVLGIVAAGVGGGYLGVRVADEVTEPGVQQVSIEDPALSRAEPATALRSAGGFTGFGGGAGLGGLVVRTGAIEARDGDEARFVVSGSGSTSTVSYGANPSLFRIAPLEGALQPGDVVVVRTQDGVVTGVLRVPTDLHEGGGLQPPAEDEGS